MKYKNILAIEISTELDSVAIQYKKNIFTKYKFNKNKNHKYILILIKNIIKENNININKINYFIINKGPGSIISKNISLNIAQTFCLKYTKIKIIKINTFNIIKENINHLKYKYKEYYLIIYNSITEIYIWYIKKNKLIYKNKISINQINKIKIEKIILTNQYQSKKKIKKLIKNKKKIKIIYPKAKYMLAYINRKLNFNIKKIF